MLSSLTNISVKAAGSYNHNESFMYSFTCLELQIMSTVEKFILEKFILANIFVSMIRSTPPQYSILLCLWQQQGQLGKEIFNMVLAKACQIISFPTQGTLPQQTSHSKGTSFGGHWINENLSEIINVWAGSTPTSVGASHSRDSFIAMAPPLIGVLHSSRKIPQNWALLRAPDCLGNFWRLFSR